MTISLIAAMTPERVIGVNNTLPWRMPADLAYFKRVTLGKPVIMGRKTFESIGKPLPGRRNIVLSRQADFAATGCDVVSSLEQALKLVADQDEVFVIGGAMLYQAALPGADYLYITWIDAKINGDAFFPEFNPSLWQEISNDAHEADEQTPFAYRFVVLSRKTQQTRHQNP